MTNNDLQNITQNTKDRTTGTPLIPGDDIRFCERLTVPASLVTPVVLVINDRNII